MSAPRAQKHTYICVPPSTSSESTVGEASVKRHKLTCTTPFGGRGCHAHEPNLSTEEATLSRWGYTVRQPLRDRRIAARYLSWKLLNHRPSFEGLQPSLSCTTGLVALFQCLPAGQQSLPRSLDINRLRHHDHLVSDYHLLQYRDRCLHHHFPCSRVHVAVRARAFLPRRLNVSAVFAETRPRLGDSGCGRDPFLVLSPPFRAFPPRENECKDR